MLMTCVIVCCSPLISCISVLPVSGMLRFRECKSDGCTAVPGRAPLLYTRERARRLSKFRISLLFIACVLRVCVCVT